MNQFENHHNFNCHVTLSDGQKFKVYANWIHNQELDYWQGWHCDAGHKKFYIDKNFDIWDGMCENQRLGNMFGSWNIVTDTICQRQRCIGCTDDLIAAKHQP